MVDSAFALQPDSLSSIIKDTADAGFTMPSDQHVGSLLRVLAASRPSSRFLELGTGTGLSAAWILDGMDRDSILDSVDNDEAVAEIAKRHLQHDSRFQQHIQDGAIFLAKANPGQYDLVFADAWPGKYSDLDLAIRLLRIGGLYVVDDMMPQPNWPEGHGNKAELLKTNLASRPDLRIANLSWSTGLILAAKIA